MTESDKKIADLQRQIDERDREISKLEGKQARLPKRNPEINEQIRVLIVEKQQLSEQRDAIRRSLWHAAQEAERQRMIAENG